MVAVERLAPRLVSILFSGPALVGFPEPAPTAHIKVLLPDAEGHLTEPTEGPEGVSWPDGRPTTRTFTPRRYDPAANTLEVQFVLHGEGPASQWAERAVPGDRAAIGGPGGRFTMDPDVRQWWVAGDESSVPAIATLIEALPPAAAAVVHIEAEGPEDHVPLPPHPGVEVQWHDRRPERDPGRWGAELIDALNGAELVDGTHVWIGTEANVVRQMRGHLLEARSLPRAQMTTRGYWRLGEANHPDHDYGED